jgi:hypothetical protein
MGIKEIFSLITGISALINAFCNIINTFKKYSKK